MDQVENMRVFLRVAELCSFSQAARTLGLPKASVSAAVAQLEASLGVRLLHRTTRRVQLSQDGLVYFERARDLLSDLDELTGHFQGGAAEARGRIRVDMPTGIARDLVIPHLPDFLNQHPELEIELSCTERLVDLVQEGFDCTVRAGVISNTTLIARPLGHYSIINCASPDYLTRFGTPRSLDDLTRHRIIHYCSVLGTPRDGFDYVDEETGEERTIALRGSLTVNSAAAYLAACLTGLGLIQVPAVGVRRELESGRLVPILQQFAAAPMPVSLVYLQRRHQPRRVRRFMDWVTELLRPYLAGERSPGNASPRLDLQST